LLRMQIFVKIEEEGITIHQPYFLRVKMSSVKWMGQ
jgi:hypothetical protein